MINELTEQEKKILKSAVKCIINNSTSYDIVNTQKKVINLLLDNYLLRIIGR